MNFVNLKVDIDSLVASYGIFAVALVLGLLTIALRRVHGRKYWMITLGVIGVFCGIMCWFSWHTDFAIPPGRQTTAVIFLFAVPMLLGVATGSTRALRARPWLAIIAVPLVFLATVFLDAVAGVNLDILQP